MSYNAKNYFEQGGDVLHIGGSLIVEDGATVEGLSGGGESYTLPAATASKLGGIKVGSGLSVAADGTLSADGVTPAANVAASEATDVAGVNTVVNAILTALKGAGLMTAD